MSLSTLAELSHIGARCLDMAEAFKRWMGRDSSLSGLVRSSLFFRIVDHFQASRLLAESGFPTEALVLGRGMIETQFVLGALLNDSTTIEELDIHDRASKAKGAKALNDVLGRIATPQACEYVAKYAARNRGRTLSLEDLARRAGMLDHYNGMYRMLSHLAAHPSLSAIDQYFDDGDIEAREERGWTISKSSFSFPIHTLLTVCSVVEKHLGTTPELNSQVAQLLGELDPFISGSSTWSKGAS